MRGFSLEEQKGLAAGITRLLRRYRFLLDAPVIEFFTDDLWGRLPLSWQGALEDLSSPQLAALLLDGPTPAREASYHSVWPLSLLAFKAAAHALAFPRGPRGQVGTLVDGKPEEFRGNQWHSSKLHRLFRKHVKPKKQHEIRQLAQLVKKLSDLTGCRCVVDVGSGQGHLSRFLAFGLHLSVTAVEEDPHLVGQAVRFDQELVQALKKERAKGTQIHPTGAQASGAESGRGPGPGGLGVHAGPAAAGGGLLLPGPVAGPAGGDPHPAGPDDLPAGARLPVRADPPVQPHLLPPKPCAGGGEGRAELCPCWLGGRGGDHR